MLCYQRKERNVYIIIVDSCFTPCGKDARRIDEVGLVGLAEFFHCDDARDCDDSKEYSKDEERVL